MTLEDTDYRLVPIDDDGSPFFDLYLMKTIRPKGGPARKEMTLVAYGMTLRSAIERIASYRVQKRHPEEALQIRQYFKEFIQELKLVKNGKAD